MADVDIPNHKDKIGQDLNIGDIVVFSTKGAGLHVARIETISQKQIKVIPLHGTHRKSHNRYPKDVLSIHELEETIMLILEAP